MKDKRLLIEKLKNQGFSSKIINAFREVDREKFVPKEEKHLAWKDIPLSIGYGQTISQPQTIAFMLELLEVGDNQKILEVGCGSGFVLSLLAKSSKSGKIYGTEIIKELAERARNTLSEITQKSKIKVAYTPEKLGWPEKSPFDRILVSAAAEDVPKKLLNQLAENGILVCPVKNSIVKIKKTNGKIGKNEEHYGFMFVPLVE